MKGFHSHIEQDALANKNFRQVLYTGKHSQLVLMSLRPNEEIGLEVHSDPDQFFRVEAGPGKCIIDDNAYELQDGMAIVVPEGAKHNIINTSDTEDLKLYTIYSPAHHRDGVVFPGMCAKIPVDSRLFMFAKIRSIEFVRDLSRKSNVALALETPEAVVRELWKALCRTGDILILESEKKTAQTHWNHHV